MSGTISLQYLPINYTNMKKHIQKSREFIARRGYMFAFLMMALAVTAWVNNFQEIVGPAVVAAYF